VPPPTIPDGCWFFFTICCAQRGSNQLCLAGVSRALLENGALYHRQETWALHLLLLMPDHLHAIVGFPRGTGISETVRNWKRLATRRAGVAWQRNFFDHRLRAGEGLPQKATYIRQNPVRAGLVANADDWPHFIDAHSLGSR
jgi:REP element-mobilizing transposase RayT